jgi:hypothetical protein
LGPMPTGRRSRRDGMWWRCARTARSRHGEATITASWATVRTARTQARPPRSRLGPIRIGDRRRKVES